MQTADATYGDILSGGSATPAVPFRLTLRAGAAPRSAGRLALEVTSPGWTAPRIVPFELPLQTDERQTDGVWTETFETVAALCYDGAVSPPSNAWYWLDLNQACASSEPTWSVGYCFGSRQALLPSCTGLILGSAAERHHRLISPQISTGSAGSTTILKRLLFKETYRLRMNADGRPCERTEVEIFTNRDGRTSPSGYYRDRSGDASVAIANVDPATVSEWVLPPLPDASLLQLIFHLGLHDPQGSSVTCGGGSGVEVRWRVDDIEIDYRNVEAVDDASACTPPCSAPAVPRSVAARALADGRVLVAWDPVPGAHHYDVYREPDEFVGRVAAPATAKRIGLPKDIADVVAFVVSDEARWLTGQNIQAGGGIVM